MGVRGLTAFLDKCPFAWEKLALKPQTPEEIEAAGGKSRIIKLAVDGYALLYHLYFAGNFNCVCGGQYAQFAEHVRLYVITLQKCGFSLFVVMDGAINPAKEATMISRENDLIKTVRQLTYSDKYMGKKVLPILAKQAFLDVLTDLNVKVAHADTESDVIVAALARANGCCAVSKDSDFFVFELPFGYIPIDMLEATRTGAVTATRFSRGKFCASLKVKEAFLPLLASAVGNDYVPSYLIRPLHVALGEVDVALPAGWQAPDGKDPSVRDLLILRVANLISKHETLESAIKAIADMATTQAEADAAAATEPPPAGSEEEKEEYTREKLEEALKSSVAQYSLNPKHASALGAETELVTKAPCGMGQAVVGAFRGGKIDRLLINVLVSKTYWCHVMVEDVDADCVWGVSKSIRAAAYSALLEGSAPEVTEYVRTGLKLETVPVAVGPKMPGFTASLAGKTSVEERTKAFYSVLGEPVKGVPEHMQVASACIKYWVQNMGGTTTAVELAAIIAAMMQNKEDQVIRISKEARPPWLSMKIVHKFAALQVVLVSAHALNQSLMCPVPPLKIADLFDGEFAHRFHHLQFRSKGMGSLAEQLRKDGIEWEPFYKVYTAIAASVSTYLRGSITEQMDGGIMWGPTGPEGKDEAREEISPALKKVGQASAVSGGFAALGDSDEEEEEEEDEEPAAPAPAPVAVSAPAGGGKGKKEKKKEEELDPELAKLMADMEAVDSKRKEQKARKKAKK